jgi:pectate lyase
MYSDTDADTDGDTDTDTDTDSDTDSDSDNCGFGNSVPGYASEDGGTTGGGSDLGAHHVWLDHVDISDGQDGNCDITRGGDFITISWSKFWYSSSDKEHQFSNLIAGSDDEPESVGKLRITYMSC